MCYQKKFKKNTLYYKLTMPTILSLTRKWRYFNINIKFVSCLFYLFRSNGFVQSISRDCLQCDQFNYSRYTVAYLHIYAPFYFLKAKLFYIEIHWSSNASNHNKQQLLFNVLCQNCSISFKICYFDYTILNKSVHPLPRSITMIFK